MLRAITEILDPIKPWQRVARGRAPLMFGVAVNFAQVVLVALIVRGVMVLIEMVPWY